MNPGIQLGRYTVLAAIGRGGMGEVWQAKDTTLGRDVAIKTLPAEFALDEMRVARFTREARLLAALNHPNIASIFGLETSDGTPFLVLELIEGDTLAERLSKSIAGSSGHDGRPRSAPIPVEESLKLAIQIADALKAAHESGVIHRDLKPANIKVTGDGRVKVLDFGLAKTFAPDAAVISADSPTVSLHATRPGVVLGTAGYMSPEQVKGEAVDKRADIWAFGCVLYEMLTGRQAFGATDPTTIMARVVDREPDFSMLPANLHPRLTDLLRRCLRKDAKQRYQDIGDVRMDLDAILADPSGLIIEPAARVDATPRSTVRWAVAVLIAAVVAGAAGWVLKPAPPRPVRRENYFLPPGTNFRNTSTTVIAVAPDGQSYVYNATGGLYLRKVRDLHAQLIVESNDVTNPFFSPDGRWVGYWNRSSKAIEKVAVSGGSAIRIAPVVIEPTGISWGADDTILFTMQNAIFRVSSDSGRPERIFESASGKTLSGATLLPEGKGVLFTQAEGGDWNAGEIFVVSLNTPQSPQFITNGSAARYTSTGHLVYAVRDQLLAIGFDLRALKPEGTPVQVAQGVDRAGTSDSANYGVSDDGSLVYVTGGPGGGKLGDPLSLVWVDREQKETIVGVSAAEYVSPRLNPKGTHVAAFVGRSLNSDVWVADLTRQPPPLTKVTINPSLDAFPVWIADSGDVVFSSIRGNQKKGLRSFFRQRADGSAEAEHLIDVETPGHWQAHSFSPDHRTLAFGYAGTKTGADIGLITMEGTPSWKPLLETTAAEWHPAISPKTGNWIAYSSNRGGTEEIYVERFPGLGDRVPVSAGGGSMPVWSADETELFYIRPDGAIMVVPIQPGSKLLPLTPRMLIPPGPYITKRPNVVNYDYDSRRQRFLLVRPAGNDDPKSRPSIVTVLNWATELAEQVPAR